MKEKIGFLFKYVKKHKWSYIAGLVVLFMVDMANLLIPKFTGDITDGLAGHTLDMPHVLFIVGEILAAGVLVALGRYAWRKLFLGSSRKVVKEMREDLFEHLETLSVEYYHHNKTGDLMSRFTNDMAAIRETVGIAIVAAFDGTVMAVMVIVQMAVYVDPKLTLIAMIPMVLIAGGTFYFGNLMEKLFKERQDALSDLTDMVQESYSGVRVIKSFVRERAQAKAFLKSNSKTKEKNLKVVRLMATVWPLLDLVIGICGLLTLIYGGYLALTGQITLGRFVAFNQYIGMLVWPMIAVGDSMITMSSGLASAGRLLDVFRQQPDIKDGENVKPGNGLCGDITLKHLTFCHQGQEEPVLSDIDIHIPAGSTVAIVGRTGKGKSTLVNLLLHLYPVEDGRLYFDGRDINTIPLAELRRGIAYVPQDNFLFSDTIARNIAFGVFEESGNLQERVETAAKAACVHDNIVEFPAGYETVVGERGVTLSGGQKQRCSIARALLKDAPILILDDALSAVDTDTESTILDNLKQYRKDRTTLIIAHRISTVQNADRILVLEDGKVLEDGTHEELVAMGGIYARIYEHQKLEADMVREEAES